MKRLSKRTRLGVVVFGCRSRPCPRLRVAQSTVVTQAEWAVYLAQGPVWTEPAAEREGNHYLARLQWTKSVELGGSDARRLDREPVPDGSVRRPSRVLRKPF
jgi:hypothetical protein